MADILKKTSTPSKPRTTKKQNSAAAAGNGMPAPTPINTPRATHDDIARLAHRLWAERGHQHGHDAEDWFRAEQLLRGRAS